MANSTRAMDDLISILKSREPLYCESGRRTTTTGKAPDQNLAELLRLIEVPDNRARAGRRDSNRKEPAPAGMTR